MIILTIRTDKPESEIGLFDGQKQLGYIKWEAHRQLAESIHLRTRELLETQGKSWQDIGGIIIYKGPGSFTGLRIGVSTANALAYSINIPAVGTTGENWLTDGLKALDSGKDMPPVIPEYGSEAHITQPKK